MDSQCRPGFTRHLAPGPERERGASESGAVTSILHVVSAGSCAQWLWDRRVRYVLILGAGRLGADADQSARGDAAAVVWFCYLMSIQIQAAFLYTSPTGSGLHYRNIISAMGNNAWKHVG